MQSRDEVKLMTQGKFFKEGVVLKAGLCIIQSYRPASGIATEMGIVSLTRYR